MAEMRYSMARVQAARQAYDADLDRRLLQEYGVTVDRLPSFQAIAWKASKELGFSANVNAAMVAFVFANSRSTYGWE